MVLYIMYGNLQSMSMDKWTTSKSTQFRQRIVKLLLQFEYAVKHNLNPLQGPTHTLTPSSIKQVKKLQNGFVSWHALNSMIKFKT